MIDDFLAFVAGMSLGQWLLYFWPFFLFDFVRYALMDVIMIPVYLVRRRRQRRLYALGRTQLFQEMPKVSVIVPGKNEGPHLQQLADSLHHQTYPNVELIVVDDGSDDHTAEIGRHLEQEGRIDMFIRNEMRGGKASAANTALRYASGEYIVHIDADSHQSIDSIEKILIPFMIDRDVGAVGGDIRVANSDTAIVTKLQGIEYIKSISTGRTVMSMLGVLRIVAGAHGAFRKDVLERLKGWDSGPGLDGDLSVKIRKLGLKLVHEPLAVNYTNVPNSFRKLTKQRYRWDRSLIRYRVRKHRDVFRPDANFQLTNFISFAENIFFNLLLNIRWWIYIVQILFTAKEFIEYIALINYLFYLSVNFIQFGMAALLLGRGFRSKELALIPYLFLMPIYMGVYLRIVRSYAYLMEGFHRVSYLDQWNPWKVSSINRDDDRR